MKATVAPVSIADAGLYGHSPHVLVCACVLLDFLLLMLRGGRVLLTPVWNGLTEEKPNPRQQNVVTPQH